MLIASLNGRLQEKVPLEGYTKKVEDNIFNNELHPETKKEYERGKGHELEGKLAHMKALFTHLLRL